MRQPTDLRQKILNASLALIGEGGLERLSVRAAARKAGVSHQAPYHYFADREAVLAAIAGDGFLKLGQSLKNAAAGAGPDPMKKIEAMGCAYVEFALSHPAHFQVMLRADAVPLDRYPKALNFEREAIRELVEVVDSAFVDLPAESKQTIVTACWALVYGLAVSILEGSLARKLGIPKARQKAEAEKAIKTIANLLGGTLNSARGPLR